MNLADSGRMTLEVPPELMGPVPRTVTLNLDGDGRFLLILVLLFFVGGGIALGWNCHDKYQQFRNRAVLRSNGRVVVGTETSPSRCCEHYTFSVGGRSYQGKAEEPLFPSVLSHVSDPILIRFLPSNPAINHPDSWEWSVYCGLDYTILMAFVWVMGCVVFIALRRDRKLARKGNAAEAIVTKCVRKDRLFRIEYEFHTEDGASIKGNSSRVDEYEMGATVWVLYLPERPRRNDLYPLLLFDVAG